RALTASPPCSRRWNATVMMAGSRWSRSTTTRTARPAPPFRWATSVACSSDRRRTTTEDPRLIMETCRMTTTDGLDIRTAPRSGRRSLAAALVLAGAAAVAGTVFPGLAQAQAWPSKPIRVVVNFPPGGAADVIARAVAAPLGEKLGQSIVVENRAGANGNIGGEAVAKSPADGYTFLMASAGVASINPQLYTRMSFDPAK